jgi:pyruvate/2-oxoglutarate dehydrogenase complex dihydrolipoamide dehydrogenase (E3) component
VAHYDAIIIGTGQAGPPLARRLAGVGQSVAIIERGRFGGTCVNTGCTPTKALVASAYAAHMARRAGDFGVIIEGTVNVDWQRVKARKEEIAGASRRAVERSLRETAGITVLQGQARFAAPHEIEVAGQRLSSDRVFINVGGRPAIPNTPGIDQVPYVTSDNVMDIDTLPSRLVVLGGSYVGLEFAQIFRRFGAEVTVIESAPRLIGREDPEISDAVKSILELEGIRVVLGAAHCAVHQRGAGLAVTFTGGEAEGSLLLVATGRRPNTDDLGLDQAGVATDQRGFIVTNDQLRTNVPGVWALGDCNGRGAFTHTSYTEGDIVIANLLEGGNRSVNDRIMAYALYTDPPLGRCGMTGTEARAAHKHVLIGRVAMEDVSRAYEKGETLGLMKIVVDGESQQILGAALLGTGCDEVVHCVLDAMYGKIKYPLLQRAMHIHPTVAEFIPTLLSDLKEA